MLISAQETSIDAYRAHRGSGKCSLQRSIVMKFITQNGGSWSIGELANSLGWQKSTVSARVNELIHETGELEERPRRKDRISGITIRPVALPAIQMELFQ